MIRLFRTVGSLAWLLGLMFVPPAIAAQVGDADVSTATPSALASSSSVSTSTQPSAPTPEMVIKQHLAQGRVLLEQSDYLGAQAEFRAVLAIDATHREALQLMTKAQSRLEAAQAKIQQTRQRLRRAAQDLAVQFAREKAAVRAKQDAQAREQLARAREQQLKLLYTKGLSLYRRNDFQGAIDVLQQMVLLDPEHPLVRDGQRLISRAEMKLAEARARTVARGTPEHTVAAVSELEQQLTAKRIEIETVLKYAKIALKERNNDIAIELLQRILVQDPRHRDAQQLLEQAQMAKLRDDEGRLKAQVQRDEQSMVNEVVKAQVLPQPQRVQLTVPPVTPAAAQAMAAKLREPISLDFQDVALGDVLQFIGDAGGVSIIPSPQVDLKSHRVTLKMTQLPLELALKYLAKNQSLAYRVEQDAILIAAAEEFSQEPLETRVFFLRSGLGPFALEAAAMTPNPALSMEPLKNLVEHTVPQPSGSKLVIDERSGALIATNTANNLRVLEQLLSQLDVTPLQVLIEARFLEVTVSELEQLGVEAVLNGDYALTKQGAAGGGRAQGNIIAKGGGFKFPDLSRQDEAANITLEGVLTALQFEAVLHLLEESKKTKTLSAPRVTTLNNQTAQIRVVEEFNYPTRYEVSLIQFDSNGDGDFDDAGETEFANVPQDLQSRDVGILLNVTPSVGKDGKTITLVLSPEVSQFSQFRDLGGGVTVPEFTSSQLTTSIVIEDGQTVMLGGLMKDTTSHQMTKVPVLGDLPLVGSLFRQREESATRKNLLIFITARLLAPRGQTI